MNIKSAHPANRLGAIPPKAEPKSQANPTDSSSDTIEIQWSDKHTSTALKTLGGAIVGGALAASAPNFALGSLAFVGSSMLGLAGGMAGDRLAVSASDALFQGDDYARSWRPVLSAPLTLAGGITGMAAGALVFTGLNMALGDIGRAGAAIVGAGVTGGLSYLVASRTDPITPLVQKIDAKFPSPHWAY